MNTNIYTGNGGTQSITGTGFEPSLTWIKDRTEGNWHNLYDAVRTATKRIFPNTNGAEETQAQGLTSFESDGFSLGSNVDVNKSGNNYLSYNFKAGTTSGLSGGTITPSSYSINVQSGIGIYKYSGTGSSGTIAHGLGSAGAIPKMIIVKRLDSADNWCIYHYNIGNTRRIRFNSNDYYGTGSGYWNNTSPTSSVFSIGNSSEVNSSGGSYIAICFCEIAGYSKISSYVGNGSSSKPPFIMTGHKPSFILMKRWDAADHWYIINNKTIGYNDANYGVYPNLDNNEYTGNVYIPRIYSNGFTLNTTDPQMNASGGQYMYMSIGQTLVGSNNIASTAY